MAKRKTKKVEKSSKVTNEELAKLQTTVSTISRGQLQIGIFQTKIHELLHHIAGLNDELTLMQGEFEKKYGSFDVNIQDGIINYNKNEQTN